jgi:hypothetical protein
MMGIGVQGRGKQRAVASGGAECPSDPDRLNTHYL